MEYVTYCHECLSSGSPSDPLNYWHIFDLDNGPSETSVGIHIQGPNVPELEEAVRKLCAAVDAVISLSVKIIS